MKRILALGCLLLVLSVSIASAASWTTQMRVYNKPTTWIDVLTTATDMGTYWKWTYALTPVNADNIRGLTITVGSAEAALINNIININPVGWTSITDTTDGTVSWSTTAAGGYTLDSNQSETFVYGFLHPYGPVQDCYASVMDTFGYSGTVYGPVNGPKIVPEPMGIMVSIMGLGSLAGFRRLRRTK